MATIVRWQPWNELATMHTEMSRLMNGLLEGNGRTTQSWVPPLDVWETESELVYAFDLPGIPEDKITVEVEDGALTVSAEREKTAQTDGDRFYRFERRHGTFSRTIGLPQGVDENGIKADYKNGVLEIHVAKPEQQKPRRIEIGGLSQQKTIEGEASKK
jgi:HSP20 family protein